MKLFFLILAAAIIIPPARLAAASDKPGLSYQVDTANYDWVDAKRDRAVPAKIYFPKGVNQPVPVIVFSHGLGGSRDGYEYLGKYWASHGYISVHVQHVGSDNAVWEGVPPKEIMGSLREAAARPSNITNRPLDISFAIDQLEKLDREDPVFKNRLDLSCLGVAGHSFGAFTTMAVAGEVFVTPGGEQVTFTDPRVKAVIAMSAQAPNDKSAVDLAFAKIKIPCFHMTGTKDTSPIRPSDPRDRRVPFDHTQGVDVFLLTFEGGDHMVFARQSRNLTPEKSELFEDLICKSSTAFWDAYLKEDAKAKDWLSKGGFKSDLGTNGTFEEKLMP
jgi:predicted dienelactone hydrolase